MCRTNRLSIGHELSRAMPCSRRRRRRRSKVLKPNLVDTRIWRNLSIGSSGKQGGPFTTSAAQRVDGLPIRPSSNPPKGDFDPHSSAHLRTRILEAISELIMSTHRKRSQMSRSGLV